MAPDGTARPNRWTRLRGSRNFWPVVALALLLLFNILFTKNFAKLRLNWPADSQRVAVALPAAKATLHGTGFRREPHDGMAHIGQWSDPADWVSWQAKVPEPGRLKIELDVACAKASAGSLYTVAVAGQQLTGTVKATDTWTAFATQVAGVVTIAEPSTYSVSVKAVAKPGPAVMNLREVVLRPVKAPRLYGSLIVILKRGAIVMLLAVGMTLVIATAGIDLSVGAVMAIAGAVAALLITGEPPLSVPAAVAVALGVAFGAGLWNGVLVSFLRLQPIVATLILLVAGRGVAQLLTGGQKVTFENPAFEVLGSGGLLYLPVPVFIVAGVAGLTLLVTKGTSAGLYIEAVGNNERASRLCGLSPGLVKTLVYGVSGLCAGVAGLVYTADLKAADVNRCGLYLELDAILAVVIGGTPFSGGRANVLGSILGALIMQTVITMILTRDVPIEYTLVVKAAVVIAVCLLQSAEFRALLLRAAPRRRAAR